MAEEAILIKDEDSIVLKKSLAKSLYKRGIDQSRISFILKLSQPMVSNYCGSNEIIPKRIENISEKILEKLDDGKSLRFQTSVSFTDKSLEGEFFIAQKNEIISEENIKIMDNLTKAFLLLKGKDISELIPKVKINIAMAKEKAKNTDDIASFLNGLIIADDKVTSNNGIRFGKSKHLSSLLLSLKNSLDVSSVMNIAYADFLENMDFNVGYLTKNYHLKEQKNQIDILLHKGDFGIEPCAYVLGKDAVDVSKKVLKIIDGIKNEK